MKRLTWGNTLRLLWVLSVLALLIGLFSPVPSEPINPSARHRADCLIRLKALAWANSLYATDHDDHYPPADRWEDSLENPSGAGKTYASQHQFIDRVASEDMTLHYAFRNEASSVRTALVSEPAHFILLFETLRQGPNAHDYLSGIPREGKHPGPGEGKSVVVSFADGHARILRTTTSDHRYEGSQLDTVIQRDHGL